MKYNQHSFIYLLIYTSFGNSPTGQTRRRSFSLEGSNVAESHNGMNFGGFIDIAPHVGVKFPPKQFLGRG